MGLIIHRLVGHLSATDPLDEQALMEYLDESSCGWEPFILASSKWSVQAQNDLVSMLDNFKKHLSVIASYFHLSCY